jgi:tRNA threonylcarbamoyladenosine modification (KEOPS) complex Cgi121 subunit
MNINVGIEHFGEVSEFVTKYNKAINDMKSNRNLAKKYGQEIN